MSITDATFACASWDEQRAAGTKRKTALVGMACVNSIPDGALISWGYNGSLVADLKVSTRTEGIRVVELVGTKVVELWRRPAAARPSGAREVVVLAADRVVDDPEERDWFHKRTGAHVVDMETGKLAKTGNLERIYRVVSDDPKRRLGRVARMLKPDGSLDRGEFRDAMRSEPLATALAIGRILIARRSLSSWQLP